MKTETAKQTIKQFDFIYLQLCTEQIKFARVFNEFELKLTNKIIFIKFIG